MWSKSCALYSITICYCFVKFRGMLQNNVHSLKKTQTNMHLIMNAISKFVTSYFWSHNVQNSHGRYKAFMNMFTSMTVILQWYDAFCDFCEELWQWFRFTEYVVLPLKAKDVCWQWYLYKYFVCQQVCQTDNFVCQLIYNVVNGKLRNVMLCQS